jgi:hypothetical protein
MDVFVRLHNIYNSSTRWDVIKQIYAQANGLVKTTLWGCKITFVAFLIALICVGHIFLFWFMLVGAIIYFATFSYARKASFTTLNNAYSSRMKLFSKNYQYVRYEKFKDKIQTEGLVGGIDEAIRFASYQSELESPSRVSSHPIFAYQIAIILAILGGAAGQWNSILSVKVVVLLVLAAYVSFIVLDAFKDSQPGISEFKKFLLWAKEDLSN